MTESSWNLPRQCSVSWLTMEGSKGNKKSTKLLMCGSISFTQRGYKHNWYVHKSKLPSCILISQRKKKRKMLLANLNYPPFVVWYLSLNNSKHDSFTFRLVVMPSQLPLTILQKLAMGCYVNLLHDEFLSLFFQKKADGKLKLQLA